ncbi:MAG: thioesterase family protein [Polyangiaceae bacterium]
MRENHFGREELASATTVFASEERTVKFQDVDAAGTIFFPRVLEYFADTYGLLLASAGLDVPKMLRERSLAAPLRHAEADFVVPLFFGDRVRVEIVAARVGNSSVTLGHRILRLGAGGAASDKLAAFGTTVHVFVDGQTMRPVALPEGLRARLTPAAD